MSLVGSFESHVRTLKTRLETAERRNIQLERALNAAQRQIAGSKDAESMRLLSERNEHLSQQLEALRDALRGGSTPTKQRMTPVAKAKEEEREDLSTLSREELMAKSQRLSHELIKAREAAANDLDALVTRIAIGEEAASGLREELKREKLRSETLATKAETAEEQLHGSIEANVPKDAIPGVSRFMVTFDENEKKRTVTVQVPSSAQPGTTIKLSRRVIELEEQRELDLDLKKMRTLLDETAGELGKALDAKRRAEHRVDLLEATKAAMHAKHADQDNEIVQLRTTVAHTERQENETANQLILAQEQYQSLLNGRLAFAQAGHNAANASGLAALQLLDLATTRHTHRLQDAYTEADAQTRAATRKATGLINDLRTQLKRESHLTKSLQSKLLGAHADLAAAQTKFFLFEKEQAQQYKKEKDESRPPPQAPDAPLTPELCLTCKALAVRLEQLLSDNAHGRERIAFLEATVQQLHSDIDQLAAENNNLSQDDNQQNGKGHTRPPLEEGSTLNNHPYHHKLVAAALDTIRNASSTLQHETTTAEENNSLNHNEDDPGTISV